MSLLKSVQNNERSFRVGNSSLAHESRYAKWNHRKVKIPEKTFDIHVNTLDPRLKSKNIRVKTVPAYQMTNIFSKNQDQITYSSLNEATILTSNKFYQTKFKMNQIKLNPKIKELAFDSVNGGRIYNEDRMLIAPGTLIKGQVFDIFGVFDGHGGNYVSEYLKLNFVNTFEESYKNEKDIDQSLRKAVQKCQANIKVLSQKYHKANMAGSCAIIALIKDKKIYVANIGDSRALKIDSKGRTVQLSEDHKPQSQSQKCRIQHLGGKVYRNKLIENGKQICGPFRVYPGKLSVSRTLGDFGIKKQVNQEIISAIPDIYTYQMQPASKLLLISDGVYQILTNEQISKYFDKNDAQKGVRSLMKKLQNNHTNDNCSIIAISFA